jgi:hypothetical protein
MPRLVLIQGVFHHLKSGVVANRILPERGARLLHATCHFLILEYIPFWLVISFGVGGPVLRSAVAEGIHRTAAQANINGEI